MHFNPQLFTVSIIQTKLFGPLDYDLLRFHCIYINLLKPFLDKRCLFLRNMEHLKTIPHIKPLLGNHKGCLLGEYPDRYFSHFIFLILSMIIHVVGFYKSASLSLLMSIHNICQHGANIRKIIIWLPILSRALQMAMVLI